MITNRAGSNVATRSASIPTPWPTGHYGNGDPGKAAAMMATNTATASEISRTMASFISYADIPDHATPHRRARPGSWATTSPPEAPHSATTSPRCADVALGPCRHGAATVDALLLLGGRTRSGRRKAIVAIVLAAGTMAGLGDQVRGAGMSLTRTG
jgi:hypothetical protein